MGRRNRAIGKGGFYLFVDHDGTIYGSYKGETFCDKEDLDTMHEQYTHNVDNRKVEGFVINSENTIRKYVRMKRGKVVEYHEDGRKSE